MVTKEVSDDAELLTSLKVLAKRIQHNKHHTKDGENDRGNKNYFPINVFSPEFNFKFFSWGKKTEAAALISPVLTNLRRMPSVF